VIMAENGIKAAVFGPGARESALGLLAAGPDVPSHGPGGRLSVLAAQARPASCMVMATCTRLAAFNLVRMRDTWP
jgi:hypothetical protein